MSDYEACMLCVALNSCRGVELSTNPPPRRQLLPAGREERHGILRHNFTQLTPFPFLHLTHKLL